MSNQYDDFDDFDLEDDAPQQDSSAMRALRKAVKQKEKENAELKAQFAEINKSLRERSIKDVLSAKGLNSKIAALIPQDVDASEEAIDSWVSAYADVFGANGVPSADAPQSSPQENLDLSGYQAIQQATQNTTPFTGDPNQIASQIAGAQTPEDLNRILFGNPSGRGI